MNSEIFVGYDLTNKIRKEIDNGNVFVITDTNVVLNYGALFMHARHYVIPAGEQSKTLTTFEKIMQTMLEQGCNRKTTVIAIGGGVVGDIAGFVSACYMRGIEWINVPTTLLAQVDSSVGGKTAVNLGYFKNIVGAFHLPKAVYISTHFLYTLTEREWKCGVGEIVKTAFLSKKVYALISDNLEKLLERDEQTIAHVVRDCIEYKRSIVGKDLRESGLRKVLNLGHTVAHALENVDEYRRSHGEYVLIGLWIESFILKDKLSSGTYESIVDMVKKCDVTLPDFDPVLVAKACVKDKKNDTTNISVIIPDFDKSRETFCTFDEIHRGLVLWKLNQ